MQPEFCFALIFKITPIVFRFIESKLIGIFSMIFFYFETKILAKRSPTEIFITILF